MGSILVYFVDHNKKTLIHSILCINQRTKEIEKQISYFFGKTPHSASEPLIFRSALEM